MRKYFKRILEFLDSDMRTAIVSRFLGLVIAPLSSVIIVLTLSIEDQGLFYLFLSISGLKTVFDFGISAVISQLTPHYMDSIGNVRCDFYKTATKLVKYVSLIYFLIVWPVGFFYFDHLSLGSNYTQIIWLSLMIVQSFKGYFDVLVNMINSTGKINLVNRFNLKLSIVSIVLQSILLVLGFGICSFVITSLIVLILSVIFVNKEFNFGNAYELEFTDNSNKIRNEVLSLAKRAGFTYLSGYAVFSMQVPIINYFCGTTSTVKYGFSTNVGTVLIGICTIWVATKFPRYAILISNSKIQEAKALFWRYYKLTVITGFIMVFATFFCIFSLKHIPKFANRLADWIGVIGIIGSSLVQHLSLGITYWPRALKYEPYSPVAFVQMIITPILAILGAKLFDYNGVIYGNLISWLIGSILIIKITKKYSII